MIIKQVDDLYNTVLATYTRRFPELAFKHRFHFASRLYLWRQLPTAKPWLGQIEPEFTANGRPAVALAKLKKEQTNKLASRPGAQLHVLERLLFRALFLDTIYGLDGRAALLKIAPEGELEACRAHLLANPLELVSLSSTSINFLYLLERFIKRSEASLEGLLPTLEPHIDTNDAKQLRRWCYLITHAVIGESLFYSRRLTPDKQAGFREWLAKLDLQLVKQQDKLNLDALFEFLVSSSLSGYTPKLNLGNLAAPNGFIIEPLKVQPQSIEISEHRNALFLMSRTDFRPL